MERLCKKKSYKYGINYCATCYVTALCRHLVVSYVTKNGGGSWKIVYRVLIFNWIFGRTALF